VPRISNKSNKSEFRVTPNQKTYNESPLTAYQFTPSKIENPVKNKSKRPDFNEINHKYDILLEKEKVKVGQYIKTEITDIKITHTHEALKSF